MPERLNRVAIALPRGDIEIPWDSREALLREVRHMPSATGIVEAFEAVGASQPVNLSPEQRGQLHMLIDEWSRRTSKLPEGIWSLRSALAYE